MKLHFLQHVPFEDLGYISTWADQHNVAVTNTPLYAGGQLPSMDQFDTLVVMGGPMGVYDEKKNDWLKPEKRFIEKAISSNKPVLGICLGAQLIAEIAGAKVYAGKHKEIGFFDVKRTTSDENSDLFKGIASTFNAFHWHGDTFDLPDDAIHLAKSEVCQNQAFQIGDKVLALQFHLESTEQSIDTLITNCADELINAPYTQTPKQMRQQSSTIVNLNQLMGRIMDNLTLLA